MEVDLGAVRENVRAIAALARPARVMAVVKADGYGHGAYEVARAALQAGAWGLGVACVDEAVALRRAGIQAPILVLGVGAAAEPEEAFARWRLSATVTSPEQLRRLASAAQRAGTPVAVHIEVETGMGRTGVPLEQAKSVAALAASLGGIQIEGLFSHLATADEPDTGSLYEQARRFAQAVREVEEAGIQVPLRHLLNTAGLLAAPELRWDLVRIGLGLYGLYPGEHLRSRVRLRPALRLMARVLEVRRLPAGSPISYGHRYVTARPSVVATLGIGYADGFTRRLSGRARGLVNGRLYPVAGRICMDQCMLDVGDDPVRVGDVACLLGPGDSGEMTLDEAALLTGTVSYEIMTQLTDRLPRFYRA